MALRLRLPELLEQRDVPLTPYAVAVASGDRITKSSIYRLVRQRGYAPTYSAAMIEALCDVLDVTACDLIECNAPPQRKAATAKSAKRPRK